MADRTPARRHIAKITAILAALSPFAGAIWLADSAGGGIGFGIGVIVGLLVLVTGYVASRLTWANLAKLLFVGGALPFVMLWIQWFASPVQTASNRVGEQVEKKVFNDTSASREQAARAGIAGAAGVAVVPPIIIWCVSWGCIYMMVGRSKAKPSAPR